MTVQVAPTARIRRSTAAQRAYDRRRHRASVVDPHGAAVPAPEAASTTPSSRRISARVPFVATIIGLLCLGLATTLLLTTRAAEDSYQLADTRAHNQSLQERTAALQRQVAAGNSAPILAEKAAELGLIPVKDPARLVLDAAGAVTVVGTPEPAEGKPVPPLDRAPAPRAAAPAPAQPAAPQRNTPAAPQQNVEGRIEARGEQPTPITVVTQPPAGARQ
ncbi:hypothetical protein [Prescottella subtropica]|uniref:hypothetical protein n=1 Tax=Prescottella subtropica TaxID=2545757 RepID=UPI0010F7FD36|nr:hypothetical protein [Prescottella subtropica]